jgi:hypothetical protein
MATIYLHPPPDRARLEERMLVHGFTPVEDLRGPLWLALERLGEALSVAANLRVELRKARATIDRQGTELGHLRKAHRAAPENQLSRAEVRTALERVIFGERGCPDGACLANPRCRNRAEMRANHGTPAEFANAVARAAAETTVAEADRAVTGYLKAWEAATDPDAALQRALNSELAAMGCDPAAATQSEFRRALLQAKIEVVAERFGPPPGAVGQHVDQLVPDLSTPIGAPSLAIAEQFDAEARAAAEEPVTPSDGLADIDDVEIDIPPMPVQLAEHRQQVVNLWPGSGDGLPPLMSVDMKARLRARGLVVPGEEQPGDADARAAIFAATVAAREADEEI